MQVALIALNCSIYQCVFVTFVYYREEIILLLSRSSKDACLLLVSTPLSLSLSLALYLALTLFLYLLLFFIFVDDN